MSAIPEYIIPRLSKIVWDGPVFQDIPLDTRYLQEENRQLREKLYEALTMTTRVMLVGGISAPPTPPPPETRRRVIDWDL